MLDTSLLAGGVFDISNLDRLGTSEVQQVPCLTKIITGSFCSSVKPRFDRFPFKSAVKIEYRGRIAWGDENNSFLVDFALIKFLHFCSAIVGKLLFFAHCLLDWSLVY